MKKRRKFHRFRLRCPKQTCANLPAGNFLLRSVKISPQMHHQNAGWSYKDWEGIFFPPGCRAVNSIRWTSSARCFDVVEINTSFYGHIKPQIAKLWVRTAKAVTRISCSPRSCTLFHSLSLAVMEPTSAARIRPNDEDERWRARAEALAAKGKLGALLIQFPVSFEAYLAESRISGKAAAAVHRVSAGGRSAARELEQSRKRSRNSCRSRRRLSATSINP